MKRVVVLSLILAAAFAINIYQMNSLGANHDGTLDYPSKSNNLKMANYTGSSITPEMVSTFIRTINDAYTYYRDNTLSNCQYIQNKLEGSYSGKFQVLIFHDNTTSDARQYSISGTSYVHWNKVNTQKPTWVYIIVILSTTTLSPINLDGTYQKGSGITSSQETIINNIIKKYETGKTCSCFTYLVGSDLENFDGQRWNAACSVPKAQGGPGFIGRLYQKDGQYYQTMEMTTGRCRYLVWVI